MSRKNIVWVVVIIIGGSLSLAYAAGLISLPFFFVAEGILITFAAGLRRRGF